MAKKSHREIWQCGKYKAGYRAFWNGLDFNPSASYAWRMGWNRAKAHCDDYHDSFELYGVSDYDFFQNGGIR